MARVLANDHLVACHLCSLGVWTTSTETPTFYVFSDVISYISCKQFIQKRASVFLSWSSLVTSFDFRVSTVGLVCTLGLLS